MSSIIIKLISEKLTDPNLDLRYVLPDLLAKKSGNLLQDDGYEYAAKSDAILVYLMTDDLDKALPIVLDVIENEEVMGNVLKDAVMVAVGEYGDYTVVYPPDCQEPLDPV